MCTTCGCSGNGHQMLAYLPGAKPAVPEGLHLQSDALTTTPAAAEAPVKTLLEVERDILDKNNRLAERNRGYFEARNVLALNLVSSPGSGKTSLLERTLAEKGEIFQCCVIEGDQQSSRDAERIAQSGTPVIQINTGKGCHLEASMVHQAIVQLRPADGSIVFIENVGNLVCPSLFDLGESKRVVVISVTEGEDKPLKYPDMFRSADLCIINKIDLLPYLKFDLALLKQYTRQVNPDISFLEVSAMTGTGMDQWYDWLEQESAENYNIEPII